MHTKKVLKSFRIVTGVFAFIVFASSLPLLAQPGVSLVESVDWNNNGTKLALGHDTGLVEIISASTGQLLQDFQVVTSPSSRVNIDVAWNPQNSDILAVASSASGYVGGIDILNTATGQQLLFLSNSWEEPIIQITWKPDGSRIAGAISSDGPPSYSRYIIIWDAVTGQEVNRIYTDSMTILSIDWSPDGSRIAAGLERNVNIWNADTGALVNTLVGHSGAPYSVVWSPDGSKLASSSSVSDHTIRIWDPTTGQSLLTISDSGGRDLAWSPEGTRIAAIRTVDGIRIWDASTGQLIEAIPQAANTFDIAWSPNGNVLALGDSSGAAATVVAPPHANAGPDQSHVIYIEACQIAPCRTPVVDPVSVTLDGSGSTGAITAYEWTRNGQVVSTQTSFTTNLGVGSHVFTLKVSNASGFATDSVTVWITSCDPNSCAAIMSPTSVPEQ